MYTLSTWLLVTSCSGLPGQEWVRTIGVLKIDISTWLTMSHTDENSIWLTHYVTHHHVLHGPARAGMWWNNSPIVYQPKNRTIGTAPAVSSHDPLGFSRSINRGQFLMKIRQAIISNLKITKIKNQMKKELYRLALLTGTLLILRKLKPEKDKVSLVLLHTHCRELMIDLILFCF